MDGNIWAAPPGLPGIELMLPVLLDAGLNQRGMPPEMIAQLLCAATGQAVWAGSLQRQLTDWCRCGYRLGRPKKTWTYEGSQSLGMQKSSLTPWEGKVFTGQVNTTIVRGQPRIPRRGIARRARLRTSNFSQVLIVSAKQRKG